MQLMSEGGCSNELIMSDERESGWRCFLHASVVA